MQKVAIVTGASSGIGEATVRRFALEGWRVVLAARSEEKMDAIAEQLRTRGAEVLVVPTDVTDRDQVQRLIDRTIAEWGRVDLLVNNAGRGIVGTIATVDPEALEDVFRLNVFAPVYATQAVVPHMRAQGGGTIVNVSSMVEKFPAPIMGPYAASKIALSYLTDAARMELDRDGIHVINVLPGATETAFFANTARAGADPAFDLALLDGSESPGPDGVPPRVVADTIWAAVQANPRQAVVGTGNAIGAAIAPLLTAPFVRAITWALNRYVPRTGEAPPATARQDLRRAGAAVGALTLGALALSMAISGDD